MKKIFSLAAIVLSMFTLSAQQIAIDREKVMDYFQSQQFDDAVRYLLPLSAQDSANVQVLGYLGYAYDMTDNRKAALRCYTQMLLIDSTNITANQRLADMLSNKDIDTAQLLGERLIRLQPAVAAHYRRIGIIFERKKDNAASLHFYQTAHELAPNDLRNHEALAGALLNAKQFVRADSLIADGLARDSADAALLALDVRSAYEQERYAMAFASGEKLLAANEVMVKPMLQLVLSYYGVGRYDDAVRVCEYLRTNEVQVEALDYYEAKACAKLKQFDKSNALLRQCLQSSVSKTAETYYYALADNLESQGKFSRAIACYDTAYYMFRDALAKYNIGRIYQTRLNDTPLAKKYFKNYLLFADTATPDKKKVYHYVHQWYSTNKRQQAP